MKFKKSTKTGFVLFGYMLFSIIPIFLCTYKYLSPDDATFRLFITNFIAATCVFIGYLFVKLMLWFINRTMLAFIAIITYLKENPLITFTIFGALLIGFNLEFLALTLTKFVNSITLWDVLVTLFGGFITYKVWYFVRGVFREYEKILETRNNLNISDEVLKSRKQEHLDWEQAFIKAHGHEENSASMSDFMLSSNTTDARRRFRDNNNNYTDDNYTIDTNSTGLKGVSVADADYVLYNNISNCEY